VVGPDGAAWARWVLEGWGPADLGVVDDVARLALLARRLGGRVTLAEVSVELRELLDLAGLRVEVEGQPEVGEEPFGVQEVQEEVHPDDLSP